MAFAIAIQHLGKGSPGYLSAYIHVQIAEFRQADFL